MEKTKEQKLASKQRYLAQEAKAIKMLQADNMYDYIDGLKYTLSLCMRYKKNLKDFIFNQFILLDEIPKTPLGKCIAAGILKPWRDTYWFDKDKANSLQQFILEHQS